MRIFTSAACRGISQTSRQSPAAPSSPTGATATAGGAAVRGRSWLPAAEPSPPRPHPPAYCGAQHSLRHAESGRSSRRNHPRRRSKLLAGSLFAHPLGQSGANHACRPPPAGWPNRPGQASLRGLRRRPRIIRNHLGAVKGHRRADLSALNLCGPAAGPAAGPVSGTGLGVSALVVIPPSPPLPGPRWHPRRGRHRTCRGQTSGWCAAAQGVPRGQQRVHAAVGERVGKGTGDAHRVLVRAVPGAGHYSLVVGDLAVLDVDPVAEGARAGLLQSQRPVPWPARWPAPRASG